MIKIMNAIDFHAFHTHPMARRTDAPKRIRNILAPELNFRRYTSGTFCHTIMHAVQNIKESVQTAPSNCPGSALRHIRLPAQ